MRARNRIGLAIVGLTLLSVAAAAAQGAEARGAWGALTHVLTVRVPPVVRVSFALNPLHPDQAPILRVETNDPVLRNQLASRGSNGLISRDAVTLAPQAESTSMHTKGGERLSESGVGDRVVRYSLVTP